jgi:uncharacterized membrane protein YgcG
MYNKNMKIFILSAMFSLLAFPVFGAVPTVPPNVCNTVISDQSNILPEAQSTNINSAASALAAQGADPHVIVTNNIGSSVEQLLKQLHANCPSWQSENGGVKNNLVVMIVSPARHKFGLFFGNEWNKALSDHVESIKMDFMAPNFRRGDIAGGIIVGLRQVSNQITAFSDAALHPQIHQTVVNNQATDMNGLWTFFQIIAALLSVSGIIILAVYLLNGRRKRKAAQLSAIQSKNAVADRLTKTKAWLDEQVALGVKVTAQQCIYDLVSEVYARNNSLESYNLEAKWSTETYLDIKNSYDELYKNLMPASRLSVNKTDSESHAVKWHKKARTLGNGVATQSASTRRHTTEAPNYSPTPVSNNSTIIAPIVINEDRRDYEPSYSSPAPSNDTVTSNNDNSSPSIDNFSGSGSDYSSNDSSSFGGSSSDWGSSDSSSFGGGSDSSI